MLASFLSHQQQYKIAGQIFSISCYGHFNAKRYLRALHHLKSSASDASMVTIKIIETSSTGYAPLQKYLDWDKVDSYSGELKDFGERKGIYNTIEPSFILIDYNSKEIIYWVSDFDNLPPNEAAAPLRSVFHHWFEPTSLFMCHAAALGFSNSGILLTGKSGSGKSTSTLACLDSKLQFAGDDFVLVDSEQRIVYSLYAVAKLNIDQFENFPHLRDAIVNKEETPREKGHIYLEDVSTKNTIHSFKIKAILLPTITGLTDSSLSVCPKADVLKALIPSSLWILRSSIQTVEKMKKFIKNTPAFRLMAGTNLQQIPGVLTDFLSENIEIESRQEGV